MAPTFISRIVQTLLEQPRPLHEQLVLLPNQRAELFIREQLQQELNGQQALMPLFMTVNQYIEQAAGLLVVEPLVLLLELHSAYNASMKAAQPAREDEPLGAFLNWGQSLLSDFGEIDHYLLDPEHVLGDLYNIQKLQEWDLEPKDETPMMQRYSQFVSLLPDTYRRFTAALLERGEAYGGLAARQLAEHPELQEVFLKHNGINGAIVAGLNALNKAEHAVLKTLRTTCDTSFLWDMDAHYVLNEEHEAGMFFRQNAALASVFGNRGVPKLKDAPAHWQTLEKTIVPVGAGQFTGQAKMVAQTLEEWARKGIEPRDIAVVLTDEKLLNPVLELLPGRFDKVNITMGYPLAQTGLAQTLTTWIDLVEYALKQGKGRQWTFYHKKIHALFTDPMFGRYWKGKGSPVNWAQELAAKNMTFTTYAHWEPLLREGPDAYLSLLEPASGERLIEHFQRWLKHVAANEPLQPMIQNAAYRLNTLLEQLVRSMSQWPDDLTLLKLIRRELQQATLDFVGEPLEGLQIMGILESRTLDFSHIIMAGVNEGVLPAGRKSNSLLPHDLKAHYELPTYDQKDAVYAYHFYRLLQRCQEAVLIYNTEGDGMRSGEASRYITQLEVELKGTACTVLPRIFPELKLGTNSIETGFKAEKSAAVVEALKAWMAKSISASSLVALTSRPQSFYMEKLVGVREVEEVDESLSNRIMGDLVHYILEERYKPYLNQKLAPFDPAAWTETGMEMGLKHLVSAGLYTKSSLSQGRNLVAVEVCRKMVHQFFEYDLGRANRGELVVLGTEVAIDFSLVHPTLNIPLRFKGSVDRIDRYKGTLQIWDYKTGSLKKEDLTFADVSDLFVGKKGKPLQIVHYAWMLWKSKNPHFSLPCTAGMFKLQSDAPALHLYGKGLGNNEGLIELPLLEAYEQSLMDFLAHVVTDLSPFEA